MVAKSVIISSQFEEEYDNLDRKEDETDLNITTLENLMKNTPAIQWWYTNILRPKQLTIIVGEPKTGKSTMALYMLKSILSGSQLLDVPYNNELKKPSKALFLSYEMSDIDLANKAKHNWHPGIDIVSKGLPKLSTSEGISRFVTMIRPYDIVVVDSLSKCHFSSENETKDMADLMGMFEALRNRGKTIIILHHVTKKTGKSRGSSTIEASADLLFLIHRHAGDVLSMSTGYTRSGSSVSKRFKIVDNAGSPVIQHYSGIILKKEESKSGTPKECRLSEYHKNQVMEAIKAGHNNRKLIVSNNWVNQSQVKFVLEEMCRTGFITKNEDRTYSTV